MKDLTPSYAMIKLERARPEDLALFAAMEQEPDTRDFIVPYDLETHTQKLGDPGLVYLRIIADKKLIGFIILALDPDRVSVEFRRIVVLTKRQGIGQLAIVKMEEFCRTELGRSRIWLDVFEYNQRARHIYEKLGYRRFGESISDGKTLYLYEKSL
jgi:RimJ/RimL family protein N-acetyltransferase